MKILQVVYHLASGGAERFVVDLCNELSKENTVYLVTINDDTKLNYSHYKSDLSSNVEYKCLRCKKGICFTSILRLFGLIKELKPDVVHTHTSLLNIYLPSMLLRRAKYVHTIHSLADKANTSSWFLKKIDKAVFSRLVQPVTISSVCKKSYEAFYGLSNAALVSNGCPPKQVSIMARDVEMEIDKYKLGENKPVFIHVARYNEEKNQKLLFDTFLKLRKNGYKFLLIVLGANYDKSDYIYLNESEDIKILGVKNNVADYLACSDYFVLSSLWEGLPISLIEAMSMGCVPICTPAGGVVDVIRDGDNGLLCSTFEESDFYNIIEKVFNNESKIAKETIRKDYTENYTMASCAKKYLGIYKNTASKHS